MITGRQIFEKWGVVINFVCLSIHLLPRTFRLSGFVMSRNVSGKLGYFLRYIFGSTLMKRCGKNVRIGTNVYIEKIESLSLGDNVSINPNAFLIATGGIQIGNNVSIAHSSSIISETHTWFDTETPIVYNPIRRTPVVIDDDVWIGCGVRIIGPCHIQSRVIVAAGAVVKGNLEKSSIYGGVPVKILKKLATKQSLTKEY